MVNNLRLFTVIFLVSLLAACGQVETDETVSLVTETAVPPTIPPPTTTYTPTPSPTQTAVPTKPPTATATPIPTLTPLPTFAPDELETAVADLLANPMNCDVPCWWGAVPGETTFGEIKNNISPFDFHISEYNETGEAVYLLLETGYVEEQNEYEIGIVYNFFDSTLTGITAYSPSVSEILVKYGQPDEVWLATAITPAPMPFRLNLVYLQEGMAFGYVADGDAKSGIFKGCFSDEETGHLRLLIPDAETSYKDFSTIFEKDRRYLPLEEATNLTMEGFMQQFSDPTQPQCLETPIELWD